MELGCEEWVGLGCERYDQPGFEFQGPSEDDEAVVDGREGGRQWEEGGEQES